MDANVTEIVAQSPNLRRDRLAALIGALQPTARVCPVDDTAAMLLIGPEQVVLRLRSGPVIGKGGTFAVWFDCAIPLHEALHGAPETIVMQTDESPGLSQLAEVLIDEANAGRCGSTETVARLSEALLVMILRRVIDIALPTHGVLAGLSHPRLHHVIVAIHAHPAAAWSIEKMTDLSGMSRSRFMSTFGDVIGLSPLVYVTGWRMGLARAALDRGMSPREVARQVGYGSAAALSRAMRRHGPTSVPPPALPWA